jgi:hypothetical protein
VDSCHTKDKKSDAREGIKLNDQRYVWDKKENIGIGVKSVDTRKGLGGWAGVQK